MPKVKLAEWIDRWKHGNAEDKDYFSISSGEEKETTDEIFSLSMGRLVKINEEIDDDENIFEDNPDGSEDIIDDDDDQDTIL